MAKSLKVTVTRPFRYEGKRLEVGTHHEFIESFAREMFAANKVIFGHVKMKQPEKEPEKKGEEK